MVTSISETTRLWEKALKKIEERLGEKKTFESFFADSYIDSINGNTIVVNAKSKVAQVLLSGQYKSLVTDVLNDLTDDTYNVVFVAPEDAKAKKLTSKEEKVIKDSKPSPYFTGAIIKDEYTFDNFVVGECNKEAHKAALYVAKNGGTLFNPLFIYSNSGLGKTHLLFAIANEIKAHRMPDAKILYITANDFVEEYVKFVRAEKDGESLKDFFKTVDVLLLDDVQFLAGRVKTEEMFFYIFQDMINKGKRVIITSDRQPIELKGLEDRLVTRFKQGLTVTIKDLDIPTCEDIFKSKLKNADIPIDQIDPNVITFVAKKFNKDVREIEGLANRLKFFLLDDDGYISMENAITAIGELRGGNEVATQLNEQKIINIVADYYKVSSSDITSKVRTEQVALCRHISMYLIRKHLDIPLKKIGDMFGGRDHTTVMSGINKVDKELKTNTQLKEAITELEKRINE